MYRIVFDPWAGLWRIQLLVLGFLWISVRLTEKGTKGGWTNHTAAESYALGLGLDRAYKRQAASYHATYSGVTT